VTEEALFFFYGGGFNGKSTFVNTIAGVMGTYYKSASTDTFVAHSQPQHSCDIAALAGARLVSAVETSEGSFWDEAKIKALTGRDPQTARFMRCDPTEFTPTQKFVIMGNHQPRLRAVDDGIAKRLKIVPFLASFAPESPDRIKNMEEQLRDCWPQILRWAIDGCLLWQMHGLDPPAAVRTASADYFAGEDVVGRWMEEYCELKKSSFTSTGTLYASFKRWAEQNNENAKNERWFSDELAKRQGLHRERQRIGFKQERGFVGVALLGGDSNEG
jgi:putative DNA primase/helicase